jgi:hypothetical protein
MRSIGTLLAIGLLFGVAVLVAQEPIPREEIGIAVLEDLNALIAKEAENHAKQIARHGSEHPAVRRSELNLTSLEAMRSQHLKKLPSWARRDTGSMNDEQLRYMVGVLVQRVAQLEREVQELKGSSDDSQPSSIR